MSSQFIQIKRVIQFALTIQNSVSFAKLVYCSIVDNTLNIRHMSTIMNLGQKDQTYEHHHEHIGQKDHTYEHHHELRTETSDI